MAKKSIVMRSRVRITFFVLTLIITARSARAQAISISTEAFSKTVVFLIDDSFHDPKNPAAVKVATGFLVKLTRESRPDRFYYALVTARHVVDPEWAGCARKNPANLELRVNSKNYEPNSGRSGVYTDRVTLKKGKAELYFIHPDDRVDVAAIPLGVEGEPFKLEEFLNQDVTAIAFADFGTREEIKSDSVGIGSSFISAGLVPNLYYVNRNYPIFKFGKISSLPSEPIVLTRCEQNGPGRQMVGWILAGNFVQGNSGSPVFLLPLEFSLAPPLHFEGPRPMLLGLISNTVEGADLSEMVPVEFIADIFKLNYPDVDLHRGPSSQKQPAK